MVKNAFGTKRNQNLSQLVNWIRCCRPEPPDESEQVVEGLFELHNSSINFSHRFTDFYLIWKSVAFLLPFVTSLEAIIHSL